MGLQDPSRKKYAGPMASRFVDMTSACRVERPRVALVLGSGLNAISDGWRTVSSVPFAELPGLPGTGVVGHRGRLVLHEFRSRRVLVFQGRVHFYEGHDADAVARPITLAQELGAGMVWLTNAAGGIHPVQTPGSLMLLEAHLNTMKKHWWPDVVPRRVYSSEWNAIFSESGQSADVPLTRGTYAGVLGPNYETPAEVRALRMVGADAVGMSTVHEAETAARLGLEVAAISCIANWAAGLSPEPLSHADVLRMVQQAADRLRRVLEHALARI